MSQVNKVPVQM